MFGKGGLAGKDTTATGATAGEEITIVGGDVRLRAEEGDLFFVAGAINAVAEGEIDRLNFGRSGGVVLRVSGQATGVGIGA